MKLYLDPSIGGDFFWPNSIVAVVLQQRYANEIQVSEYEGCDLAVYGPYPPARRTLAQRVIARFRPPREQACVRLHLTMENQRPDYDKYDFHLGFDLGISSPNYLRFPYWMFVLAWPELIERNVTYSRYGSLLKIDRLMEPLGAAFLDRPRKAAFFTTHLREPRKSLHDTVSALVPVDGYGRAFDRSVKHHKGFNAPKSETLSTYAFNLCPENSIHPGYYTEKVPEAFHSGCLPLGWTDPLVATDFNPNAFLNLYEYTNTDRNKLATALSDHDFLTAYASEPLLKHRPSLRALEDFVDRIIAATNA